MSEALVDSVVRVVDYNTGDQQGETAAEKTVLVILAANGTADAAAVRDALATAVESGQLQQLDSRYQRILTSRPILTTDTIS